MGSKTFGTSAGRASGGAKLGMVGWLAVITVIAVVFYLQPGLSSDKAAREVDLRAITWNMAAINNNPFEYWITNEDPGYNQLMEDVSTFINSPGDNDVPVHEVFTQAMFDELCQEMVGAGWEGVAETRARWQTEYKDRRIITEFIKDGTLGKKRLASMPDRYTNTINTVDGAVVTRPTVINCYAGDLSTVDKWWAQWKKFMFGTSVTVKGRGGEEKTTVVRGMLSPIKNSKYPAISPEEEAISIPLQTMAGAIFDSILVYMMNTLAKDRWMALREDMCEKLNRKKNARTVEILETTYKDADVQFLQEVAATFIQTANGRALGQKLFDVHYPQALDGDRDQNSLVLLKKGAFKNVQEVTSDVVAFYAASITSNGEAGSTPLGAATPLPETLPVSAGDLFVIKTTRASTGEPYLFASFHGDTNGLCTVSVVTAVQRYAASLEPQVTLLFGLDANTYDTPKPDQQGVVDFAKFYRGVGLNSCYGPQPNPKNFTTFHARTYLQPQLNKAIRYTEKDVKGDKNPKDFILFFSPSYDVLQTTKDNTGVGKYVEGMVFPTLNFPSDHGITSTKLGKPTAVSMLGARALRTAQAVSAAGSA